MNFFIIFISGWIKEKNSGHWRGDEKKKKLRKKIKLSFACCSERECFMVQQI